MLSIIIPTYNEEKYILKLLDSILMQSYRNFEIIIVDAGSDDKTVAVVKDFFRENEERMEFIDHKIEVVDYRNVSRQKNKGRELSRGGLLLFIDADIVIPDENLLYKIVKAVKSKKYSGATTKMRIDGKRIIDRFASNALNFWMFMLNLAGFNSARGGFQLVKRKYFEKINGFNEEIYVAEDVDLMRRLIKYGRVLFYAKSSVIESNRRYVKKGYFKIILGWTINGIWSFFFGKSYSKEWKAVR